MAISIDTIQLKFNVKPSYEQQQIQQLSADLKQATVNYETLGKVAKDSAKEHSRLYAELSRMKTKRDELAKQKTLTEKQQQDLAAYNNKIEELTDKLAENEEQRSKLRKVEEEARKELVNLQSKMNGVTQSTLKYNMTIQQLGERERELRAILNNTDPSTEEWEKYNRELSETKKRIADLRRQAPDFHNELKLEDMTIKELNERISALRSALESCKPNTGEFEEYSKALQETNNRINDLNKEANKVKTSLTNFAQGFNHIAFAITNILAIKDRIVSWADQYVQSFAKMDDAMVDVMKYTGQTKQEVEEMNETFKKMTTRTAREELNALAGAAGRLGITSRKNIEGFVDAADKINVALGDDLGEGAIDQIGKLTMVFGEDKTKGLNGAMLATGSAINVLGANSSANTGFITEFTSSMAGMAVNARISQTDIMGYASALSQAGIEGQTASGVFAQLITKMFTDPARFAKAARLDVQAFTDLLKTDANAAILQFLEGLKANGGFDALAPALKSLKMQGTQAVPVISSLINKMDELKKAQNDARQAYDEGTSIIDEFNNANSSAAAKLEIAKKAMNDAASDLGKKLMPIVETSISTTSAFLRVLSTLVGFVTTNLKAIVQLTMTLAAYNLVVNASAIANSRFVASVKSALVATRSWFATLTANPIGMVVAAVTLLASEIYHYISRARQATKIQEQMNEAMREAKKEATSEGAELERLVETVRSATVSENERREALEKLNGKLMALHLGNLTEEQVRTGNLTTILDEYNKKLETQIKLKRLQAQQEELLNKKIDIEEGGYKEDITLLDRFNQSIASLGQTMISGHIQGFGEAWSQEWGRVDESFKNRALRPIMEGLDKVQQKIKDIKEEEQKSANTVSYIGEVVISGGKKTNSTSEKSDEELEKEQKQRDKQRKEIEAQAKQAYEEELLRLKQQYQGRRNLQDEWHGMELKAEQRYIDNLTKIRQDYGASESDKMETVNMQLDHIAKEANYQRELQQKELNRQLQTEDQRYAAEQVAESQKRLNGQYQDEEAYALRMEELEIEHQKKLLKIKKAAGEDTTAEEKRLNDLLYEHRKKAYEKEEKDIATSQNDANEWLRRVEWEEESLKRRQELNEEYRKKGLISETQYQQNLTDLQQEQSQQRETIQQAAFSALDGLMSASSQLFNALEQRETSQVEARYKKRIEAAKKQGKDTTKLEEEMEEEKAAIRKKYADKQFKLQILQIISATAQSIANVWKEWAAFPVVAAALTAAAAAQGAIQLATAKAQADQAAGLYKGGYSDEYQEGYTRKGNPREQAGVIPVHRNEFVANHKTVANPQIRPVLDVIDRHQKVGDVSMLNATRMLEEAYGRGRYRGGYSQGDTQSDTPDTTRTADLQTASPQVLEILRRIASNTEDALTVRELRREIRHQEQLESNARR